MTTETITMAILTHPYQAVLAAVALFYAVNSVVADLRRSVLFFPGLAHPRLPARPLEPSRPLMGRQQGVYRTR